MARSYQRPVMPQNWTGEARNMYIQLIDVLDRLHLPVRMEWLDDKVVKAINDKTEISDSGWIDIDLPDTLTAVVTPQVRQLNKTVYFRGCFKTKSLLGSNEISILLPIEIKGKLSKAYKSILPAVYGATYKVVSFSMEAVDDTSPEIKIKNQSDTSLSTAYQYYLDNMTFVFD